MAHVIARNFCARSGAPHQAGVHGAEAPEVNTLGQLEFFRGSFQMPQDVPPLRRVPVRVAKTKSSAFLNFVFCHIRVKAFWMIPWLSKGTSRFP